MTTVVHDCATVKVDSYFLEKHFMLGWMSRYWLIELAINENHKDDYGWIKKPLESKLFSEIRR